MEIELNDKLITWKCMDFFIICIFYDLLSDLIDMLYFFLTIN